GSPRPSPPRSPAGEGARGGGATPAAPPPPGPPLPPPPQLPRQARRERHVPAPVARLRRPHPTPAQAPLILSRSRASHAVSRPRGSPCLSAVSIPTPGVRISRHLRGSRGPRVGPIHRGRCTANRLGRG